MATLITKERKPNGELCIEHHKVRQNYLDYPNKKNCTKFCKLHLLISKDLHELQ